MMPERILIVDDEALIRKSLRQILVQKGYDAVAAASAAEARSLFKQGEYSLALLDLRLPDGTGLDLLTEFRQAAPDLTVIMMTAFGSIESAVDAMRLGAYDYVNKPFKARDIEVIVRLALETGHAKRDTGDQKKEEGRPHGLSTLVSEDAAMARVVAMVRKVVHTPAEVPVLVLGESGTGKEMIARAVHSESDRHGETFIAINCAAIPAHLLESELFGHEKGAFTDARQRKIGLMERGQGGTVFLDEIGDMDLNLQVKLLRVLEDRKVRRIGGSEQIPLDVRIIAATNRSLEEAIKEGRFREDLYYRLKLINIQLPPLRERRADILPLARHFIESGNRRFGKSVKGITGEAGEIFLSYPWPGNVRELKNIIERTLILEDAEMIAEEHLPPELWRTLPPAPEPENGSMLPGDREIRAGINYDEVLNGVARHLITRALELSGGNKARAARLLSMERGTLRYNIARMGLEE